MKGSRIVDRTVQKRKTKAAIRTSLFFDAREGVWKLSAIAEREEEDECAVAVIGIRDIKGEDSAVLRGNGCVVLHAEGCVRRFWRYGNYQVRRQECAA